MDLHETKIYVALLIAAVILGTIVIHFFMTAFKYQRRMLALYKEKMNAEINTQERERARIASDLHDDLGPMLSAVKLLVNNVDLHNESDRESMQKANRYMDGLLLQLRTISNNLVPMALGRKGLVVAIEEFVSELNEKREMQVKIDSDQHLQIPDEISIHLYRIIHEVIHNADKHASATEMKVSLKRKDKLLVLYMKDNGSGFDTSDSLAAARGLGLRSIVSRVETIRGNIYIKSGAKAGTEYTIEIPV